MRNILLSIFIWLFGFMVAHGQSPDWDVDENKYEHVMTFVAFVNVDGKRLSNENDKIGAFVGDECRGVTNLVYVSSVDQYYAYLSVLSNTENEEIQFKIYDSSSDRVVIVDQTVLFAINGHHGSLFQAFSIAKPALNNQADVISFGFEEIDPLLKNMDGNGVVFRICEGIDIARLTPVFELSEGADFYLKTQKLQSGIEMLDFTNDVELHVMSEDQSQLKRFLIKIEIETIDQNRDVEPVFYKMDASCGSDGAIKVIYPFAGNRVDLSQDGVVLESKTVLKEEVVFDNLNIGKYHLKVKCFEKEVQINLKN